MLIVCIEGGCYGDILLSGRASSVSCVLSIELPFALEANDDCLFQEDTMDGVDPKLVIFFINLLLLDLLLSNFIFAHCLFNDIIVRSFSMHSVCLFI